MFAITIDTDALARALDEDRDRAHYLDLDDGSLLTLPSGAAEPGWEEKYEVDPERYLRIKPLTLEQRLALRETFMLEVGDHQLHLILRNALQGRRALRNFAYQLDQHPGLNDAWQCFYAHRLQEHALEWLEEHELHPRTARAPEASRRC